MSCLLRAIIAAATALLEIAAFGASADAAFPGANGLIAFAATNNSGDPTTQVYTVKASGKGLRLVSEYGNGPAFSPAGRTLAYPDIEFDAKGTGEIYAQRMRRPFSEQRLTKHRLRGDSRGPGDFDPAWSPDGRVIAFTRCYQCDTRRERTVIFTMRRDGTNPKRLTVGRSPAWSTLGRIALVRDGDLYTVTPDGQDAQQITTGEPAEHSPDWSPDGTRIVFHRQTEFRLGTDEYVYVDVYAVPTAGGPVTQLTTDHSSYSPAFSPDGQSIVFSSSGQLRLMGSSGGPSLPIRIAGCKAKNDCNAFDPDWQPVLPGGRIVWQVTNGDRAPRGSTRDPAITALGTRKFQAAA